MTKERKPRSIIEYYVPTIKGLSVPVLKPIYLQLKSMDLNLRELKKTINDHHIVYYLIPEL